MKRLLLLALLLTGCHLIVKPPPLPKHGPLAAPTVAVDAPLLPTVTPTP